jgi:SAM-dependent methyltransferase
VIEKKCDSVLEEDQTLHWDRVAAHWELLGPPLRPSEQDISLMQQAVARWSTRPVDRRLKALLWGVTPEIAAMAWPEGTDLLAVDRSAEMIRLVWPGDLNGRKAERADWLQLPVINRSVDVVIGDGSFNCVDYPEGYESLAESARRVLRDGGTLVVRFFVRPEEVETPDAIFSDLTAGRIRTFDGLRLRLLMATQGNTRSIILDDVWQVWRAAGIDLNSVISLTGWRPEVVQAILNYQGNPTRFAFPTLREVRAALSKSFEELAITVPDYQLGDRCPTLVFRPLS